MGPLIPLFWISGDTCPGFQSQGGFPRLRASSPVHNRFLSCASGATPANLFMVSMACHVPNMLHFPHSKKTCYPLRHRDRLINSLKVEIVMEILLR